MDDHSTILPGRTPVSNYFLDFVMADLSMAEVKVYIALAYEEFWGGSDVVSISYQELARRTALHRVSIMRAVWLLNARRLIDKEMVTDRKGSPEGNRYRLVPLPECPQYEDDPRWGVQA